MSLPIQDAVHDLALDAGAMAMLGAMARHAKPDGSDVRASLATLASESGHRERAAQLAMRALEAAGLIEATSPRTGGRRKGGKGAGAPTVYRIHTRRFAAHLSALAMERGVCWQVDGRGVLVQVRDFQHPPKGASVTPLAREKGAKSAPYPREKGARNDANRVQNLHEKGAKSAPEQVMNKSIEQEAAPMRDHDALNGHHPAEAATPPVRFGQDKGMAEAEADGPLDHAGALALCRELGGIGAGQDTPRRWPVAVLVETHATAAQVRCAWALMRRQYAGQDHQPGVLGMLTHWRDGDDGASGWQQQAAAVLAREAREAREQARYDAQRRAEADARKAEAARRAALTDAERADEDTAAAAAAAASRERVRASLARARHALSHPAAVGSAPPARNGARPDPPDGALADFAQWQREAEQAQFHGLHRERQTSRAAIVKQEGSEP